jgi:hypothetical protein
MRFPWYFARLAIGSAVVAVTLCLGCERKEKIIEIKTPGGGVEVERSLDDGEVDVRIERERQ